MLRTFLDRRRDIEALKRSGAFDEAWYRERHLDARPGIDAVRHYVTHGRDAGLHPHPLFDGAWYLRHNTDVRAAGVDPFLHYATCGAREGRAPGPWAEHQGQARRGHAGPCDTVPLSFLEEARAAATVGMVEMRTPDFVSGWFAAGSDTETPRIAVGGNVGTATLFNPRPDVARLIGRPAHGFLYAFARPVADDEEVVVRFADGTALAGSPSMRGAQPGGTVRDASVHFDRLPAVVDHRLVDVSGWLRIGRGDAAVEVLANGRPQRPFFGLRTDVIDVFDDPHCVGFELTIDAADAQERGETALDLEVRVDGRPAEHRRVPIALVPAADPASRLQLFMHIPKTAGISIGHAVKSRPELRSLWLYDRGPVSISDQLDRFGAGALADVAVVGGHFPYGLHRRVARGCDYVTFLREPASYIKSFHLFMRYVARAPGFAAGDVFGAIASRPEFDNAFVRWFAEVPDHRRVDADDLRRATARLERDFVFVGLVERMEESMARLSRLWRTDLPVLRENRTPPLAEAASIDTDEIARRAPQAICYDRALHARAQELFWT